MPTPRRRNQRHPPPGGASRGSSSSGLQNRVGQPQREPSTQQPLGLLAGTSPPLSLRAWGRLQRWGEQQGPPPHWPGSQQPANSIPSLAPHSSQGLEAGPRCRAPRPLVPPDPPPPRAYLGLRVPILGRLGQGRPPRLLPARPGRPRGGAARAAAGSAEQAARDTPPADGCRLQRRSACAGGWAPCPQPRAWRPPRGPPPPRPPRPAPEAAARLPLPLLLARGVRAPASASSAAALLPARVRLPGRLLRCLPPGLFPDRCGMSRLPPPWSWPAGLFALPSPGGGSAAREGRGGEHKGEDP